MDQCECFFWARSLAPPCTTHHPNCHKYDPTGEMLDCIRALIKGIDYWSFDEDGIHHAALEAYKQARWLVGEPLKEQAQPASLADLAAAEAEIERLRACLIAAHDDDWTAPFIDRMNSIVRENASDFFGEASKPDAALASLGILHGMYNQTKARIAQLDRDRDRLAAENERMRGVIQTLKHDLETAVRMMKPLVAFIREQGGNYRAAEFFIEDAKKTLAAIRTAPVADHVPEVGRKVADAVAGSDTNGETK